LLILLAVALMFVSFPHALEDFHYGDLARFGITLPIGIVALSTSYAALVIGMLLVARGSSRGALLLALVGVVWCLGALIVHGHDLLYAGPNYRHGLISRMLELSIIVLGALLAVLGVRHRALAH
jgi:hypothetical protein